MTTIGVSRLLLALVIVAVQVPNGYTKDINSGWPSGEVGRANLTRSPWKKPCSKKKA